MKKIICTNILISAIMLAASNFLFGQNVTNQFQLRSSFTFSKKIVKHLKVELTPELRFTSNRALDKYLLNAEMKYKPYKFFSLSACYRFIGDNEQEGNTEFLHRFQFNTLFKKDIKRWEPGVRVSYTNYIDETDEYNFLRYKAFLSYNIKYSKLTPQIAFETFHMLNQNIIYKYRYKLGFDYNLTQKLMFTTAYKFDFYMTKYKNRHILEIGLKLKI